MWAVVAHSAATMRTENSAVSTMRKQLKEMGYGESLIELAVQNDINDIGSAIDFLANKANKAMPLAVTASSTSLGAVPSTSRPQGGGITAVSDLITKIETTDNDPELQQAIVKSKSEANARNQASTDETQLAKAIAESLKHSAAPQPSWQDHQFTISPDSRVRTNMRMPVGLRNIGNTCYLNSLLQVYFHLPAFRCTVLSYKLQQLSQRQPTHAVVEPSTEGPNTSPEVREDIAPAKASATRAAVSAEHAHVFMVELQRLFANMALGNQCIVDPSAVARAIRNADGKQVEIGAQEDLAEFNQLLLDMVQLAVAPSAAESNTQVRVSGSTMSEQNGDVSMRPVSAALPPKPEENFVRSLFITKFKQEIVPSTSSQSLDSSDYLNSGKPRMMLSDGETSVFFVDATSEENRNIYSGLDEHAQTHIDYRFDTPEAPNASNVSSQASERPDVMQIGQVEGNTEEMKVDNVGSHTTAGTVRKRAEPAVKTEWITNLAPVLTIFLKRVRYNCESKAPEKVHEPYIFETELSVDRYLEKNRNESERARKKLRTLLVEREEVTEMLTGILHFPAHQSALKLAPNNVTITEKSDSSRPVMIGPLEEKDTRMVTTPENTASEQIESPIGHKDDYFVALERVKQRLHAAKDSRSPFYVDRLSTEAVSESIKTLEALEAGDRSKSSTLQERRKTLASAESTCYQSLRSTIYELFAVLVHDGAPMSGHYLVFVRSSLKNDSGKAQWLRFSDISVSYVSEEEMFLWSMGGHGHASAYCLIYANPSELADSSLALYQPEGLKFEEECRNLLPQERLDEVKQMRLDFEREHLEHRIKEQKDKAEFDASSIVELATSELKQAKSIPGPAASSAESSITQRQPWRTRSLVEFGLLGGFDTLAIGHALKQAWAHHMTEDKSKNIFDVFRRRMLSPDQYPPVGGSFAPEQVLSADPDILVLDAVLHIMETLPGTKLGTGDLPFLGFAQARHFRNVMYRETSLLEERMAKLKKFYSFALRSNALAIAALRATFRGNWQVALWRLYHLSNESHLRFADDPQSTLLVKEYVAMTQLKFCQHFDLANVVSISVILAASEHAAELIFSGSADGHRLAIFVAEHALRILSRDVIILEYIRKDWEAHHRDWSGVHTKLQPQFREQAVRTASSVGNIILQRVQSPNVNSVANIDQEARQAMQNAEHSATQFSWTLQSLYAKVNELGLFVRDAPAARRAARELRNHAISNDDS